MKLYIMNQKAFVKFLQSYMKAKRKLKWTWSSMYVNGTHMYRVEVK